LEQARIFDLFRVRRELRGWTSPPQLFDVVEQRCIDTQCSKILEEQRVLQVFLIQRVRRKLLNRSVPFYELRGSLWSIPGDAWVAVSGIAYAKDEAKVTLLKVDDKPGVAARIFGPLSDASINVDMIVQNVAPDGKHTDMTFTVHSGELVRARVRPTRRHHRVLVPQQQAADPVEIGELAGAPVQLRKLVHRPALA